MTRVTGKRYVGIDQLLSRYAEWKEPIRKRLVEFSVVRPSDYYYELVYCLLTPQSSALNAGRVVDTLRRRELAGEDPDTVSILASRNHYIRFHNTKAARIVEVRAQLPDILRQLSNGSTSTDLRAWLVTNVNGLGWKEASHFLRNIGHRNLAILDRHVLKHLKKHAVLRSLPKTISKRRYLQIEQRFVRFAAAIGIPMDELDLLFWSSETGEILK